MKLSVVKRAPVMTQIWEIAEHIAKDNLDAAERFLDAVDESIDFLRDFPESGEALLSRRREPSGIRLWQVKRFSDYVICFRADDKQVELLALIHGARLTAKVLRKIAAEN